MSMPDDFDGLDDDLIRGPTAVEPATEPVTAEAFIDDLVKLEPYVEALVAGFSSGRIFMNQPSQRQALVDLHAQLEAVIGRLTSARLMIEHVFRDALVDKGAGAIPLPDGHEVILEPARGQYVTRDKELYEALLQVARTTGDVPEAEVHDAIRAVTEYKANHAKLNAMAKKRGSAVADIIAAHRTFVAPPASAGRVRFP